MFSGWYDVLIERNINRIKLYEKNIEIISQKLPEDKKHDERKGTNFYKYNKEQIKNYKSDIKSCNNSIEYLKKYKNTTFKKLSAEKQLATILHSILHKCGQDNCNWYYLKQGEGWETDDIKKMFLKKAKRIINVASPDAIIAILKEI